MKSFSESYKQAGVDVVAGYRAVELMKSHIKKTCRPGILSDLGGFGGLFEIDLQKYGKPVLVSGTDGVGTKLKIAFLMDKHDTVGIDCVAMCVNDIVCSGAEPLFFLDYIALGKNIPEKVATIVSGVAAGCALAGCGLIGGETAEMPGFYPEDEYDLAGFSVGVVNKDEIISGEKLKEGDALIGLASSGVHSNGFSLVRKVFNINAQNVNRYHDELAMTLGECLLAPTNIYVQSVLALKETVELNAISHITGGGFYENIPRMLRKNLTARIEKKSFETPPVFKLIQELGKIDERDMFNTFNMGIGMVLAVSSNQADEASRLLSDMGTKNFIIGEVVSGENGVELW